MDAVSLGITLATQSSVVEEAITWVDFLQRAGGWGVAVVFGYVIVKLWSDGKAKDERLFQTLDKQNETLKGIQDLRALIAEERQK